MVHAKKFLWGLKFEFRDWIANISQTNLNNVINVATNHELIMGQEWAQKKSSLAAKLVNQGQDSAKPFR